MGISELTAGGAWAAGGQTLQHDTRAATYARHRFPAEIISRAVWPYHVFGFSSRDIKLFLAECGIVVTHESIRQRCPLLTADGCGTAEIMHDAGVSNTTVWRWQERFICWLNRSLSQLNCASW
jgi:hypothetical protein